VILACIVLIQITSVTDGQTDKQTPRRRQRRAKHSAVARKNRHQAINVALIDLMLRTCN